MPKASRCCCPSPEGGFSLLEVIVSLALLGPLLIAGMSMLKQSAILFQRVNTQRFESIAFLRTTELLQTVLREHAQHTLPIPPRVHAGGVVTFTDGTNNPITNKSGALKPDSYSNAISSVSLDGPAAVTVHIAQIAGMGVRYFGCTKYNGTPSNSLSQFLSASAHPAFLGIGVDGLFELSGAVKKWGNASSTTPCWEVLLSPNKSTVVPAPASWADPLDVRLLIPILRSYTLYLDSAETLRYLGHYAGGNIENQPLIKDISQLTLAAPAATTFFGIGLGANILFRSQRLWQWEQIAPVGRDLSPNLLLN